MIKIFGGDMKKFNILINEKLMEIDAKDSDDFILIRSKYFDKFGVHLPKTEKGAYLQKLDEMFESAYVEMTNEGMNREEIAKELGMTKPTLLRHIKKWERGYLMNEIFQNIQIEVRPHEIVINGLSIAIEEKDLFNITKIRDRYFEKYDRWILTSMKRKEWKNLLIQAMEMEAKNGKES
jgi:predicted transcriptional regulator